MQLFNTFKNIISKIIDLTGLYNLRLKNFKKNSPGSSWLILMYHRIIPDNTYDPFNLGMCVTEKIFDEQLIYIKRHYNIVRLDEVITDKKYNKDLEVNTLSITFDDGYVDNLQMALPLLKKHNIPATVFVATGGLEDNAAFWWDRLIHAFKHTNKKTLDLKLININSTKRLSLNKLQIRKSIMYLQELLWNQTIPTIHNIITEIETVLEVENKNESLRLTRDEIKRLHDSGVEIGAHTVSHPNLTLVSKNEIVNELKTCKSELESIIGAPVKGFAFPGGRGNDVVRKLIEEAGYDYAVSTDKGINFDLTDRYSLLRVGMPNTSVSDFKRCLSGILKLCTSKS